MDTLNHQKEEKGVLEQMKAKTVLKAKLTKQKLPYFGHIMTIQGSLERTVMLGQIGGIRKRGSPSMR